MFKKLGETLQGKFSRKDELSRQLEIVRIFDLYRAEIKNLIPESEAIRPVSLQKKTLTVKTRSAVMANELRLHEAKILKVINQTVGHQAVKRVIYRF